MNQRREVLGVAAWIVLAACGTEARNVGACREIEAARCSAAVQCGYSLQAECLRFAHDNCLHGLATATVEPLAVTDCREAIGAAAACAMEQGEDALTSDCSSVIESTTVAAPTVCDLILRPELAMACAFLDEVDEAPEQSNEVDTSPSDAGLSL